MMRKALLTSVTMVPALAAVANACPMCKDSIPNSDAAQATSLPGGFNNSVYLLLLAVFTVAASLIAMFVKVIREANNKPGFEVVRVESNRRRAPRQRED